MLDFILAMTGADGKSNTGSIVMLVVLGVLMVGMILMSIIPQRKRQKQAQEMMAALKKGDKIKTIGGFVGSIVGIDNGNNSLDIDVSANQDGSVVVTIDKSAIYTVMNPVPQQNFDESKTVDASQGQSVVTADDMEADKKAEEKKAKKGKKSHDKEPEKDAFEMAAEATEAEIKAEDKAEDKADNKVDEDKKDENVTF